MVWVRRLQDGNWSRLVLQEVEEARRHLQLVDAVDLVDLSEVSAHSQSALWCQGFWSSWRWEVKGHALLNVAAPLQICCVTRCTSWVDRFGKNIRKDTLLAVGNSGGSTTSKILLWKSLLCYVITSVVSVLNSVWACTTTTYVYCGATSAIKCYQQHERWLKFFNQGRQQTEFRNLATETLDGRRHQEEFIDLKECDTVLPPNS